jgi:hypothetical protein
MSALPDDEAIAAHEADRRQANYFRDELLRHIDAVDGQAGKFQRAMAEYEQRNDTYQVRRLQNELQSMVAERRTLTDMLAALEYRFS